MHYLLLVYFDESDPIHTDDQTRAAYLRCFAEMRAGGSFRGSGRLHPARGAKTVRAQPANIAITDGPFVETKEHLGGYVIVDAADLDAALAQASRISNIAGASVEVRHLQAWTSSPTIAADAAP